MFRKIETYNLIILKKKLEEKLTYRYTQKDKGEEKVGRRVKERDKRPENAEVIKSH